MNHLHARSNEVVRKTALVVFALSNQATPTGIAPDAKCFAGLCLIGNGGCGVNSVLRHSPRGPFFARLDGQTCATKKFLSFPNQQLI